MGKYTPKWGVMSNRVRATGERRHARCVAARTMTIAFFAQFLILAGCASLSHEGRRQEASKAERQEAHRASLAEPNEPYWPQRLAEMHLAAGDEDSALYYCDTALTRSAGYAPAVALRSEFHYRRGEHAEAVALLERARDANGSLPPALGVSLSLHLEALGEFDRADQVFAALPEGDPDVRALYGYRILRGDNFKNAVEPERSLVEHQPDVAAHRNNLGIALLYAGKPEEAKQEFEKAHEMDPKLPGPLYNLAIVERFYFFDEKSSNEYLQNYLLLASDDPDGLVEQFAAGVEPDSEDGAK